MQRINRHGAERSEVRSATDTVHITLISWPNRSIRTRNSGLMEKKVDEKKWFCLFFIFFKRCYFWLLFIICIHALMYLSSLILAYPLRYMNDILRCSIWQDNAFFLSNSSQMPSFYARRLCDFDPLLILDDTGQMLSFYSVALLLLSTEGWRQRKDGEGERERARERISGLTKLLRDLEKEKS